MTNKSQPTTANKPVCTSAILWHTYYNSQHYYKLRRTPYLLHNIDIVGELVINGLKLSAIYQCGQSYYHNDYNSPSTKPELSEAGGTDPILKIVDNLYESDFDDNPDHIDEIIAEISSPNIATPADLWGLYAELQHLNQ